MAKKKQMPKIDGFYVIYKKKKDRVKYMSYFKACEEMMILYYSKSKCDRKRATIRYVANINDISKSTLHYYIHREGPNGLHDHNPVLYEEIIRIIGENKHQRGIDQAKYIHKIKKQKVMGGKLNE